ncbi:helix-turn-helix domain-containing protein [Phytoactinopolyspora halotolerans]|uniref:GAF domain-containing protein n=1 Tax=Phytoactinopolyspora halotolerans TaxID=1981512 RepID=A0A6L9S609_9ACTN|nr:GAF domain-containing protein [Phytoactinopolyspora halotolerans]NEE00519.1 GAF domain-containing protein [Phytoactinopolyspora halotolerans]
MTPTAAPAHHSGSARTVYTGAKRPRTRHKILGAGDTERGDLLDRAWGRSTPSLALPLGIDAAQRWRHTAEAHERFVGRGNLGKPPESVRPVVLESWERSHRLEVNPDAAGPPIVLTDDALTEAREANPLRHVMPVVQDLLVRDASEAGVIVAVTDAEARLLWADGDQSLLRGAERIHIAHGAVWSESAAGTNAVGTALVVGELVQIFGSEHFAKAVHPWSCTAAPIRDPHSGRVHGTLAIAGRDDVASPQSALLIRSAVAAVEAELRLHVPTQLAPPDAASLRVLGRDRGELTFSGRVAELSLRHTELLMLLTLNPDGLTAAELAELMYEHDAAEVTVRAELSRLRKAWPQLLTPGRPYRLRVALRTDAAEVADCLQRGAHRRAVDLYRAPVLPRSDAPGVITYRRQLHSWLRTSLLRHARADVLLRFARSPAGQDDAELWQACLARLPYGSRRREEVGAALDALDSSLRGRP